MPTPTVGVSPITDAQYFDNDGNPLSGGKLFFYIGGSWTSAKTTYSNSLGTIANPNPIVLDSSGRASETVWLTLNEPYNIELTLPNGTTVLNSWENITVVDGSGGGGALPAGESFQVQFNNNGVFGANDTVEIIGGQFTTHNDIVINTVKIGQGPTVASPSPLFDFTGTPTSSLYFPDSYGYTIPAWPAGLGDSQATALVAPTNNAVFTVYGPVFNEIGTITFLAGQTEGVFSGTGYTLNMGELAYIEAPNPPDPTLQDVSIYIDVTNVVCQNLIIGYDAGGNSTNKKSISIGYQAANNAIGAENIVIGVDSHISPLNPSNNNVIIGNEIHKGFEQIQGNVLVGQKVLSNTTNPVFYNTIVGFNSGSQQNIGHNNVIIGSRNATGTPFPISGATIIGDNLPMSGGLSNGVLIGANGVKRLQINSNGAWSANTGIPSYGANGQALVSRGDSLPPVWGDVNFALQVVNITNDVTASRAVFNNKVINFSAGQIIIPSNEFLPGDLFIIINSYAYSQFINQGAGLTLWYSGTNLSGNRLLAVTGMVMVLFVSPTVAYISGAGLS
jgi:hypothetical protein